VTGRRSGAEGDKNLRDLRSSGMLRNLDWSLVTDVSGHPIVPIFLGQAVQEEWTVKDGTDRLSRKVGNYKFALLTSQEGANLIYTAAEA
jgi:hypothetical protein